MSATRNTVQSTRKINTANRASLRRIRYCPARWGGDPVAVPVIRPVPIAVSFAASPAAALAGTFTIVSGVVSGVLPAVSGIFATIAGVAAGFDAAFGTVLIHFFRINVRRPHLTLRIQPKIAQDFPGFGVYDDLTRSAVACAGDPGPAQPRFFSTMTLPKPWRLICRTISLDTLCAQAGEAAIRPLKTRARTLRRVVIARL
jgi:hypothetical protein